jgi:hypothetical protein
VGAASASAERRKPRFIGEVFLFGTAMNLSKGGRGAAGKTGQKRGKARLLYRKRRPGYLCSAATEGVARPFCDPIPSKPDLARERERKNPHSRRCAMSLGR